MALKRTVEMGKRKNRCMKMADRRAQMNTARTQEDGKPWEHRGKQGIPLVSTALG